MKHHDKNIKFGRVSNQRRALIRSLALSLIEKGKIKTTEAKAKELRPFIEKLVTRGKTASLPARRIITSRLGGNKDLTKKLIEEIAPKYKDRKGGYTRVVKVSSNRTDASPMALIEFV